MLGKRGGKLASTLAYLRKLQNYFDFYSKGGSQTHSISITWKLVRNANSRVWGGAQHTAETIPPGDSDKGKMVLPQVLTPLKEEQ